MTTLYFRHLTKLIINLKLDLLYFFKFQTSSYITTHETKILIRKQLVFDLFKCFMRFPEIKFQNLYVSNTIF